MHLVTKSKFTILVIVFHGSANVTKQTEQASNRPPIARYMTTVMQLCRQMSTPYRASISLRAPVFI